MPTPQLSPECKAIHQLGMFVVALGVFIMGATLVSAALNISNIRGDVRMLGICIAGGMAITMVGIRFAAWGDGSTGADLAGEDPEMSVGRHSHQASLGSEKVGQLLRELHTLHVDGILSDDEYSRKKQEVLDRT